MGGAGQGGGDFGIVPPDNAEETPRRSRWGRAARAFGCSVAVGVIAAVITGIAAAAPIFVAEQFRGPLVDGPLHYAALSGGVWGASTFLTDLLAGNPSPFKTLVKPVTIICGGLSLALGTALGIVGTTQAEHAREVAAQAEAARIADIEKRRIEANTSPVTQAEICAIHGTQYALLPGGRRLTCR